MALLLITDLKRRMTDLIDAEEEISNTLIQMSEEFEILSVIDDDRFREIVQYLAENQFMRDERKIRKWVREVIGDLALPIIDHEEGA